MASPTYTADVIVLKKTKLGESDLILTCLASDGQQVRFVAKGARKPGGSFASRLELFSCAHVLLVKGKSLDIVKEVRLHDAHSKLRSSMEKSVAASSMAELLAKTSQDGLEAPRLYDMTQAALSHLESCAEGGEAPVLCAYLIKSFALCGFAPSIGFCASCGAPVGATVGPMRFSYEEGGAICPSCRPHVSSIEVPGALLSWLDALLRCRFSQLESLEMGQDEAFQILSFCQAWSKSHMGITIKSLDFMMTFTAPLPSSI